MAAWALTLDRNAWKQPQWPRYVGLHHGRVVLVSTLWRRGNEGGFAWQSSQWIYDTLGAPRSLWSVSYVRIGDSYSGSPPYTADLDAVLFPAWYPAVQLMFISWRLVRRARREASVGRCRACGYALAGLPDAAPCPECGKARAPAH